MTARHSPTGNYWREEIEMMPREKIEEYQLKHLREELRHAYDNAPYYRRSFDAAGVSPSDLRSLADLENFPFIDKKTQRDTQGVGS
ncbi:MAG: hypothetical protein LBK91_06690, partial [Synergistaceae bacterium]|nr:hypothetical protein [Synergistaceae bacterium]